MQEIRENLAREFRDRKFDSDSLRVIINRHTDIDYCVDSEGESIGVGFNFKLEVKDYSSSIGFNVIEDNENYVIGGFKRLGDYVVNRHRKDAEKAYIDAISLVIDTVRKTSDKPVFLSDSENEDRIRSCIFKPLKEKFKGKIMSFTVKDRSNDYDIELLCIQK